MRRRPYRSATGLALAVTLLLMLDALMILPQAWGSWQLIQYTEEVIRTENPDTDRAEQIDLINGGIACVTLLLRIPLFIFFGMWIYRANWNARAPGAKNMEFTPGWSVGWYFIPFANLVKPFQAMREIWQASQAPQFEDWRQAPSSALLPFWWFLWIANGILGQVALRLSLQANTPVAVHTQA
jgi:hypothetical protein